MGFNEQMFFKSNLFLTRVVLIHFELCLGGETSKIVPKVIAYFYFSAMTF